LNKYKNSSDLQIIQEFITEIISKANDFELYNSLPKIKLNNINNEFLYENP
jgi:hypothetical protein